MADILRCEVCGEELFFPEAEFLGRKITMKRACRCQREERERQENERLQMEQSYRREKARNYCFSEYQGYMSCTFETDDMQEPGLSRQMRNYADNFGRFLKDGNGLLFCGNVGAGKTFYSACIANKLIDDGYTVMFSNFVTMIHRIQDETYKGLKIMDEIRKCDLLIIDDLGVERDTEFMKEHVYNIIDTRYRMGKPIIVSTNLTGDELKNPKDVTSSRIYSRIMERCLPIVFNGPNRRKRNANYQEMLEMLND